MKTVTIPTSQSPFVVMVNGAKYVYPAGSVQDVPDEVAVVIEAHNKQTAKPNEPVEAPFDCDCGGGGGAQSDWNQTDSSAADFIKNKPFRVASLNFETMALDMTPEEINEVIMSGGAVLFSSTMTPIGCDTSDDDITAVYASSIGGTVEGDEGILVAAVFKFSPTDGSFMGAQTFLFSGGIILG